LQKGLAPATHWYSCISSFFDNKYFMQPGGQVHLRGPPEFAIKKDATWNPADGGFATSFARMAIIWDLGELPTGKARRSQRRRLQVSAFVKFQHLRNSIKAAGQQCKRMIFHQQLRGFLKEHPDLTGLTEKDLDKFETTCSSEKQDQRAFDSRWVPPVQEVPRVSTPAPEVQRMGYTPSA
jgi:hypothetical protein